MGRSFARARALLPLQRGKWQKGLLASWWHCVISLGGGWLAGWLQVKGCRPCCVLGQLGLILEEGGALLLGWRRREKVRKCTQSSARGARMTFLEFFCRSSLASWTGASPLSSSWTWSSSPSFLVPGEDGRTAVLVSIEEGVCRCRWTGGIGGRRKTVGRYANVLLFSNPREKGGG